ncbi:MAG TPA: AraC family transcriptional regulator [Chthoniobacteraceae bacterium]|nr:AraC family transcriptional regulator [Chthoniobacteraceae bacterium]
MESPLTLKLAASTQRVGRLATAFRWHAHPFYELGVLFSGECEWQLHGGSTPPILLKKGEAILLPPGWEHREQLREGVGATFAWLGFADEGPPPSWSGRALRLGSDLEEVRYLFRLIEREHHEPDPLCRQRVALALRMLLLLLERRSRQADAVPAPGKRPPLNPRQRRCVESGAHYFRENLRDPLSIAQLAAYHSLSPAHFSSLFRLYHGISPRAFLHQARLAKAGELLALGELTVKEIARETGFVDAAHLCKAFKAAHGVTPGAWGSVNKS